MHQFKQFEHPNFVTVARLWRIPLGRLFRKAGFVCFVLWTLWALAVSGLAQNSAPNQNSQAPSSQSQDVPDAPSAVKPPSQFPTNLPPAARPDSTSQDR